MGIEEALGESVRMLRAAHIAEPALTARILLADTLGRSKAWLEAHSSDHVTTKDRDRFRAMVKARADGVPLQYVRGVQEFFGLEFAVSPAVLIPRPETEHLVEAALDHIRAGDRVVDIGTGSGAIAVSLALNSPAARVLASDISLDALQVAKGNADRLGAMVSFFAGDAVSALAPQSADLVVTNPPYIPLSEAPGLQEELRHEPSMALFGGRSGLSVLKRIAHGAREALRPGGWFLAEIGFGTQESVRQLLLAGGWAEPRFLPDLAGIDRVVVTKLGD